MNSITTRTASIALAFACLALAQTKPPATPSAATPEPPVSFDVATIKLAKPLREQAMSGKMHIGLNIDGARADFGGMSLQDLVGIAFKVKPHQVVGPDWLKGDRFDIVGTIPEGVATDRVNDMVRSLLIERFGMKFHREQREQQVYALEVAKGGIKAKEVPPDEPKPPADSAAAAPPAKEDKGVTTFGTGDQKVTMRQTKNGMAFTSGKNGNIQMVMEEGHMRMKMDKMTCAGLADALSRFVDKPIVDMTELKGHYQMTIDLSMADLMNAARAQGMAVPANPNAGSGANHPADSASDPSGSSVFSTVETLGLKLKAQKAPIDMIVIDHMEKAPSEN